VALVSSDLPAQIEASSAGQATSGVSFAAVDADFVRRLDLWGAYHRIAVASMTMAVTFGILPQPDWLLWLAAFFLGVAALVPSMLRSARSISGKAGVRTLVMLIDVCVVSMFIYRWGARSSPAPFMYVPIVSGWTLIRQRNLGRLAAGAVLIAYGTLLWIEQLAWPVPHGVGASTYAGAGGNALLYFVTLACSIVAVHGLVDFTMARLREHNVVVSLLTAEKRTREREMQLAQQLGSTAAGVARAARGWRGA
jgi:hypothetical protein